MIPFTNSELENDEERNSKILLFFKHEVFYVTNGLRVSAKSGNSVKSGKNQGIRLTLEIIMEIIGK